MGQKKTKMYSMKKTSFYEILRFLRFDDAEMRRISEREEKLASTKKLSKEK